MHKWGILKGSRTWNDCRMSYGCGGLRVGCTNTVRSEDMSHCRSVTCRVTAKTATPTKVDSKLSDVHLESLER